MAYTTLQTSNAPSLASGFRKALAGIGNFFVMVGEANARSRRIQQLQQMSDAELAERGMAREDIVRYVFSDRYYM